jgi:hypothetical protein
MMHDSADECQRMGMISRNGHDGLIRRFRIGGCPSYLARSTSRWISIWMDRHQTGAMETPLACRFSSSIYSQLKAVCAFDLIELPDPGDLDPFCDWKVSYLLNDFDTDYLRLNMVYIGGTVPKPSTLLLLIPGLATLGFARRKASTLRGTHHNLKSGRAGLTRIG